MHFTRFSLLKLYVALRRWLNRVKCIVLYGFKQVKTRLNLALWGSWDTVLWPCQFSICYIQKISRHWIILNYTSIWLTIVSCCHHHFNFVKVTEHYVWYNKNRFCRYISIHLIVSPGKHSDTGITLSGVCLSIKYSHTFLVVTLFLVTHKYVSQAIYAFLVMMPLFSNEGYIEFH